MLIIIFHNANLYPSIYQSTSIIESLFMIPPGHSFGEEDCLSLKRIIISLILSKQLSKFKKSSVLHLINLCLVVPFAQPLRNYLHYLSNIFRMPNIVPHVLIEEQFLLLICHWRVVI